MASQFFMEIKNAALFYTCFHPFSPKLAFIFSFFLDRKTAETLLFSVIVMIIIFISVYISKGETDKSK
jgi:hypothetical protein